LKVIGASGQVFRWIREGITIPFLNIRPPSPLNQGISLLDATPEQLTFIEAELARFVESSELVGVAGVFPRGVREFGRGGMYEFAVIVRVDGREDGGGGGDGSFVGSSTLIEGRGCAAVGQEPAFDFEEAMGGLRFSVVGGISAGSYFFTFSVVAVWRRCRS
jgi:hypothetical protein